MDKRWIENIVTINLEGRPLKLETVRIRRVNASDEVAANTRTHYYVGLGSSP